MNTEELIGRLARDVKPVPAHAVERRLAAGLALGGLVTLILVLAVLGPRNDFARALLTASFWMKAAYTGSLAMIALWITLRLARPDGEPRGTLWLIWLPLLLLAAVSAIELASAAPPQRLAMWLGESWKVCSSLIFAFAIPLFAGLIWAFRRFGPTRLRLAGFAAGLTAGAAAATIYCLHCPEVSALFVLTWYSLGIVAAGLVGAAVGPRLLRW